MFISSDQFPFWRSSFDYPNFHPLFLAAVRLPPSAARKPAVAKGSSVTDKDTRILIGAIWMHGVGNGNVHCKMAYWTTLEVARRALLKIDQTRGTQQGLESYPGKKSLKQVFW